MDYSGWLRIDLEFVEVVPLPWNVPGGGMHLHIPSRNDAEADGIRAAVATGGTVDCGPIRAIGGDLNRVRGGVAVGRIPFQHHLSHAGVRAKIHLDPLRVRSVRMIREFDRAPIGGNAAIHGIATRITVLDR